MASGRKRKFGSIVEPTEDELNGSIHNESVQSAASGIDGVDDNEEDIDDNVISETEVFHDPVHGYFELPQLLLKILDTPQFQRLRNIRQMGGSVYVFTGACHTRFQHCLGVAYLAGKLCKVLRKRQPELNIIKKDVLCLQMAGLCHDIGHGPLSHFFDNMFMPMVRPDTKWSHEKGSIDMFNHMMKENDLELVFRDYGLDKNDIIFIKELISGPVGETSSQDWPYQGRSKDKSFLYEIVSNKTSGIDVDKWDYLARDCFHLGIPNNFNYRRFLKFARVISYDGKLQICMRDEEIGTLYEMFHIRSTLQRRSYLHKTGLVADLMLRDALVKANDYIFIPGENGKMVNVADCVHDMYAYTKLNDHVFTLIQLSQDENLKEARQILERLDRRDLYKLVSQKLLPHRTDKSETKLLDEIFEKMDDTVACKADFIVHIAKFNYGMKDQNPVNHVGFYRKDKPNVGIQIKPEQISLMLPTVFSEQHIRLFSRKNDPFLIKHASSALEGWFNVTFPVPGISDLAEGE